MKHNGSTSDHLAARDAEIFRAFRELYLSISFDTPREEIYRRVVESPSTRLWVSERHATDVMSLLLRERRREVLRRRAALDRPFPDERRESKRQAMINRAIPGLKESHASILDNMFPERRAMYEELYRRVCVQFEIEPGITLTEAVFRSIHQPADRFYLSPESVPKILLRHRLRQRSQNKQPAK